MGFSVVGIDEYVSRIEKLNGGNAPIFEPGLDELLSSGLKSGRLSFTTKWADAIRGAGVVIVAYDTPVNEQDEADLTSIYRAISALAEHLDEDAIVIIHSQVPVGTCDVIRKQLESAARRCAISCVPENLRLGCALERFRRPAMIVIGGDEESTLDRVEAFFSSLPCPKVRMNLRSAEMTKHAINSYLATCVSYINEISNLCDLTGADAMKVSGALRMDERVSRAAPLLPGGLGFAGATLARDIRALQALGKRVDHPTHLFDAVLEVNQEQKRIVARRLNAIYGSLVGLQVGILGLTYKTGTSTLRRSTALEIACELRAAGARVKGYDPKAAMDELMDPGLLEICGKAEDVAVGSDALVIVTEWQDFKQLNFASLRNLMRRPVLIDTKNLLDPVTMAELGYLYSDIGRGHSVGNTNLLQQVKV